MTIAQDPVQKSSIALKGACDEQARFDVILNAGLNRLELNLDGLTIMNSFGVMKWIEFMQKAEGKKLTVTHLRPFMVNYANQVTNFLPSNVSVESFYVPYIDATGDHDHLELLKRGTHFDGSIVKLQESIKLPNGVVVEPDVRFETYFRFMKLDVRLV